VQLIEANIQQVSGKNLEALLVNFQKRIGLIEKSKMIAMATVLDPRIKKLHFESPTACASAVTDINSELKKSSVSVM
jgi:hypothetical protein